MSDEELFWQPNESCNNIATIAKHLWGNMRSRWTDFLTTDGEKEWRNREGEFESDLQTRAEMLALWNQGWQCLFDALNSITDEELDSIVYIRNQGHTISEAINRQLAHYAYHVGQIVLMGKIIKGEDWASLSIPKGKSSAFNAEKFSQPKSKGHYTDDLKKGKKTT